MLQTKTWKLLRMNVISIAFFHRCFQEHLLIFLLPLVFVYFSKKMLNKYKKLFEPDTLVMNQSACRLFRQYTLTKQIRQWDNKENALFTSE